MFGTQRRPPQRTISVCWTPALKCCCSRIISATTTLVTRLFNESRSEYSSYVGATAYSCRSTKVDTKARRSRRARMTCPLATTPLVASWRFLHHRWRREAGRAYNESRVSERSGWTTCCVIRNNEVGTHMIRSIVRLDVIVAGEKFDSPFSPLCCSLANGDGGSEDDDEVSFEDSILEEYRRWVVCLLSSSF